MVTTEQDFLDEIVSNRDDDAPRLVFADWLGGIGDPRSEFIRLQVESATLPLIDPRKCELDAQADLLLRRHRTEWCRPFRSCASSVRFHRGLIEEASLRGKFRARAKELFAKAPIRDLCLDGGLAKIMVMPEFDRLRGLRLRNMSVGESRFRKLFESPQAQSLELLDLHFSHASDATIRLAVKELPRLRKIGLDGTEFNIDRVGEVAFSEDAAKIEEIWLPHAGADFMSQLKEGGLPNARRIGVALPFFRMILEDTGDGICELPAMLGSISVFRSRGQPVPGLAATHFNKDEREYLKDGPSKLAYATISFSDPLGIMNEYADSIRSLHTLVLDGWSSRRTKNREIFDAESIPERLRVLCISGFEDSTDSLCRFLRSDRASHLVRLRIGNRHQPLPEPVLQALCDSESLSGVRHLIVDTETEWRKRLSKRFGRNVCQFIGSTAPQVGFGYHAPWSGRFL